jgi:hypothetical protein
MTVPTPFDPFRGWTPNSADEPCCGQATNQISRKIDLVPTQTVVSRLGEGMVVIVPALSQAQDSNHPLIATLVGRIESTSTKLVTDRIHGPRDVMGEKDSHQSAPEQTSPAVDKKRDDETQGNPDEESPMNENSDWIVNKMFGIALGITLSPGVEHPAYMRVKQALERAMWVAWFVRETMMLPVSCHPLQDLALDGHRTERKQNKLQHRIALETAMGRKAMKPNRDSETGQEIETHQKDEVHRHELSLPQLHHCERGRREGNHDRNQRNDARKDNTKGDCTEFRVHRGLVPIILQLYRKKERIGG